MIVVSDFNEKITKSLLDGSQETLLNAGISGANLEVLHVPGAFELPLLALKGAKSGIWDAIICLGCVIRGGTPHFDYVCQEVARGIMQVGLDTEKPVIFGVLTTDTYEQALERSGLSKPSSELAKNDGKNIVEHKGVEAAETALKILACDLDRLFVERKHLR